MPLVDSSKNFSDKTQIGLGAILCRAKLLSHKMLIVAIKALASQSPALQDPDKGLVPDVTDVREISVQVAKAVIEQAIQEGLATVEDIPTEQEGLVDWIRAQMWEPRYRQLQKVGS